MRVENAKSVLWFADWETDGLDGPMVDIALLDHKGNQITNIQDLAGMAKLVADSDGTLVVWHSWMSEYMQKHDDSSLKSMRGRIVHMVDMAFPLVCSHSIAGVTEALAHTEHQGNALSDAQDLFKCYQTVKKIYGKIGSFPHFDVDNEVKKKFVDLLNTLYLKRDASTGAQKTNYRKLALKMEGINALLSVNDGMCDMK